MVLQVDAPYEVHLKVGMWLGGSFHAGVSMCQMLSDLVSICIFSAKKLRYAYLLDIYTYL